MIDTHAHLDFPAFNEDRQEVINRAQETGIKNIINVGTNLASSHRSLVLSQDYEQIYATVGIHPHDADQLDGRALDVLKDLARADKVVAIGEIGLDFHYDNSPREVQTRAFKQQLHLAGEIALPVVIHSRDADDEIIEILKEGNVEEIGGILHCFGGDLQLAQEAENLGLYLGLGGIVTFNNADRLRQVVKQIPLQWLLLETDCPYLTPSPHRGKRNEPAYVKYVAEMIADVKGMPVEEVKAVTSENARKAYQLA